MKKLLKYLIICIAFGALAGLGINLFERFVFELPTVAYIIIVGLFTAIGLVIADKISKGN
ncbi:MAG: hypothetical protein FWF81_03065 [Defluviitaleaceae bacterium]|nr:hypothetical protein [Defluviitaleaceae bacterium]